MDRIPLGSSVHGILGKNTGVGCHSLLQRAFPTQGLNSRLLHPFHWQLDSLPLSHLGSPEVIWHPCWGIESGLPRNRWGYQQGVSIQGQMQRITDCIFHLEIWGERNAVFAFSFHIWNKGMPLLDFSPSWQNVGTKGITWVLDFLEEDWLPTSVLLPGGPYGQRSPVGCSLWSHTDSDPAGHLCTHTSDAPVPPGVTESSCLHVRQDGLIEVNGPKSLGYVEDELSKIQSL